MKKSARKRKNRLTLEQLVIKIGLKIERLEAEGANEQGIKKLKEKAVKLAKINQNNNRKTSEKTISVGCNSKTVKVGVKNKRINNSTYCTADVYTYYKGGKIYKIAIPEGFEKYSEKLKNLSGYPLTKQTSKKITEEKEIKPYIRRKPGKKCPKNDPKNDLKVLKESMRTEYKENGEKPSKRLKKEIKLAIAQYRLDKGLPSMKPKQKVKRKTESNG